MAKNTKHQKHEEIQSVGEVISRTDAFFKKYGKTLTYSIVVIALVVAAIFATIHFYINPLKAEAVDQTFIAEQYFRAADYEKALNGDGNALGFAQIIEDYGTKSGKAVYFYAGVSELHLGNAQNAIDYLLQYDGSDPILLARANACIGDAYVFLDNNQEALAFFLKAANIADNTFAAAYLLKAGIISEELGKKEEALKHYQTIKDKYPQTYEGFEVDKYISRITIAE